MAKTAVIAVDLQNDFMEGGALAVPGANSSYMTVVNSFIRASDASLIVASMDWHLPAQLVKALRPHVATYGEHCIAWSHGAALDGRFAQRLAERNGQIVRKGQQSADPSAFCGVNGEGFKLDTILHINKITKVQIIGLALDVCVRETAMEALALGYEVELFPALTRALTLSGEMATTDLVRANGGKVL